MLGTGGRLNRLGIGSNQAIGAYAYKLYGDNGTGGALGLLHTYTWEDMAVGNGFYNPTTGSGLIDSGTFTPAAAPPATNSTGNAYVDGALVSGSGASASKPVLTGTCVVVAGTQKGGLIHGEFAIPAGNCAIGTTVIMTVPLAAPNGYSCKANNVNTPGSVWDQTGVANPTTTATLTIRAATAASTAGDIVKFICGGY